MTNFGCLLIQCVLRRRLTLLFGLLSGHERQIGLCPGVDAALQAKNVFDSGFSQGIDRLV